MPPSTGANIAKLGGSKSIATTIIGSIICILFCMFGIRMCFDAEWGVNIGGLLMVAIGGAGFVPLVSSR